MPELSQEQTNRIIQAAESPSDLAAELLRIEDEVGHLRPSDLWRPKEEAERRLEALEASTAVAITDPFEDYEGVARSRDDARSRYCLIRDFYRDGALMARAMSAAAGR